MNWATESGRPPTPGARTVAGYALQWNVPAAVRSTYDEVFMARSLVWPADLPACVNHEKSRAVGRLSEGSLRIEQDDIGLWVELDCPHNVDGDEILYGARFGTFKGWSISFHASAQDWDGTGVRPLRTVRAARLEEISIADVGAHRTTIGIKSRMKRLAPALEVEYVG